MKAKIMFAHCEIIEDQSLENKLRIRYAILLRQLEQEGFKGNGILETKHSALLFPMVVAFGLIGNEVMQYEHPLQVNWHHPLMVSADGRTIAYPMGLGVRFYTFFSDGTAQRTVSIEGPSKYDKRCRLHIDYVNSSVGDTWLHHLAFCEQRNAGGKTESDATGQLLAEIQIKEDSLGALITMSAVGWGGPFFLGYKVLQAMTESFA